MTFQQKAGDLKFGGFPYILQTPKIGQVPLVEVIKMINSYILENLTQQFYEYAHISL